ncbi:MAG: helix-turn-helix domain-containing protein [Clostridiaceae bacterium]|jgi:transcriptional regulator with XRE-family HTH domain|nr:helix-turn-helix domain-containing protein [Clostridiaceae bacterium]
MNANQFGKRLKELRLAEGMSQRTLGEMLTVCNQTISFWESGCREPGLDMFVNICKFFDVSADFLLGIEE